ncbi:MAG: ABC transporter permease, partial [Bacilli bacterium]
FVIISKGIDLSVGSVLALSAAIGASVIQEVDATSKLLPNVPMLPTIIGILVTIGVGTICGMINGTMIAKAKLPPFIATLSVMTVARGLALIYTKGKPVGDLNPGIKIFGANLFNVIPTPVIVFVLVMIVCYILLNKTRFGKNVFAIGGNEKAARVSGVDVDKNIIKIYALSGLLAGVAGVVFMGRVGSIHPGAATGYELTAIAATTIGGTSHSGGLGSIGGAFIGALVLGVLASGLSFLGIDSYWQEVVIGLIIAIAVVLDMRKNTTKQ